jgi:hypothetical protein
MEPTQLGSTDRGSLWLRIMIGHNLLPFLLFLKGALQIPPPPNWCGQRGEYAAHGRVLDNEMRGLPPWREGDVRTKWDDIREKEEQTPWLKLQDKSSCILTWIKLKLQHSCYSTFTTNQIFSFKRTTQKPAFRAKNRRPSNSPTEIQ